eukprot:27501-Eustigmatos_ZCMA.PRE.1
MRSAYRTDERLPNPTKYWAFRVRVLLLCQWMTAGRGVVHSEMPTGPSLCKLPSNTHTHHEKNTIRHEAGASQTVYDSPIGHHAVNMNQKRPFTGK